MSSVHDMEEIKDPKITQSPIQQMSVEEYTTSLNTMLDAMETLVNSKIRMWYLGYIEPTIRDLNSRIYKIEQGLEFQKNHKLDPEEIQQYTDKIRSELKPYLSHIAETEQGIYEELQSVKADLNKFSKEIPFSIPPISKILKSPDLNSNGQKELDFTL
jgi:DNA repair ATPase RecN